MTPNVETHHSTKRRRNTNAKFSRKRACISDELPSNRCGSDQSTLTQIAFVRSSPWEKCEDDEVDFEPLPVTDLSTRRKVRRHDTPQGSRRPRGPTGQRLSKRNSTLTQMDFFNLCEDGDEPLALEKELLHMPPEDVKLAPHDADVLGASASSCKTPPLDTNLDTRLEDTGKSSQSIHKQNLRHAREAAERPRRRRSRRIGAVAKQDDRPSPPTRPALEIQDSTEFQAQHLLDMQAAALLPITPTKIRDRIPSSQTPESLVPSPTIRSTKRQPLIELSTNIPVSPSSPPTARKLKSSPKLSVHRSPRRTKIGVLKLPTKMSLPRTHRVEDSQQDIWSLQATSSPKKDKGSSQFAPPLDHPPTVDIDSQISFPDVSDVLQLPEHLVSVQDDPVNVIPELGQPLPETNSDFGSPVANDTQFIRSLHQRISSPVLPSDENYSTLRTKSAPIIANPPSPSPRGLTRAIASISPPRRSPLPLPRLIPSPARFLRPQHTSSTSNLSKAQSRSLENVLITQVPLNDIEQYLHSSSTELLLPPDLQTQKSTHPASIPHPSQTSTQAPSTQGYLPSSSAPLTQPPRYESEVERITIMDSSSLSARLSQFQRYDRHVDEDINMIGDSQDGDDLDLDLCLSTSIRKSNKPLQSLHSNPETQTLTQTPTQRTRSRNSLKRIHSTTQESPVVIMATTRAERDAALEVILLPSSPQAISSGQVTPQRYLSKSRQLSTADDATTATNSNDFGSRANSPAESPPRSTLSSSSSRYSPSPPRTLKRKYSPLPGYDNDTQSDFTQGGHVTAAYVHRAREDGWLLENYLPKPYQVKKWKKSK